MKARERRNEGKKKEEEKRVSSNGIKPVAEFHNRRYDNHAQRLLGMVLFSPVVRNQHTEFPYTQYRVARRVSL